MLKRAKRLSKTKDIELVNKNGKSFFTRLFILKFLKNNLDYSRITVVTSTKVSKNSTARNRVRRYIQEQLRLAYQNIKPGMDLIIYVSKSSLDEKGKIADKKVLSQTILFALEKSGLLLK